MSIPKEISVAEKILRVVFHPMNFNSSMKLKSNSFKSKPGEDEVSVIRFDFCDANFCKKYGKEIQNPYNRRNFCGFALLNAKEVFECDAEIEFTPRKTSNPYHADIKIGFIAEQGKQLPAEFQFKVDEMTRKARFYEDQNPDSTKWEGKENIE
ncbi:MAG: hypothetical protein A2W98_02315 [Bacteroidetes bacterium GWF2_33_38]|nr:MAG: hypothetical protein A2W98_02315 [Bacteroidetes bacterium GWF2_33_38]OFY71963.1 MAG: hypothetical protein A2265_04935 [Bacteroidetes bacterium RIFOXYA12_FULL_33_9]OFY90962.1 MAG: hypothetical protein A2236_07150 [Bacteroidetes bacterium RIFOXYA2_FULL_33_7]HBX51633.1 hypothetical protein [Bacteroidales bacterium]